MTTAPLAEQAIAYARWIESKGWKPTPLHVVGPDGRTCGCPKGGSCGRSAGKHNIANNWQRDLRGAEIFVEMALGSPRDDGSRRPPRHKMNVGILTGEASGIFVLDIDPNDNGFESMRQLIAAHGALPATFIVKTGTGGFHYYFQMPDFDMRNSAKKIAPGIDIRANGGMVVAPGSVSYAGPYVIQVDAPVAAAPEWLLEALRPAQPVSTEFQAPAQPDPFASEPAANVAVSAAPAAPHQQSRQEMAYEKAIVTGELGKVGNLATAGWAMPWDVTTFEVACQLIELANAEWSSISLEEAWQRFMAACPPEEPGYSPQAKWDSALQRVGGKQRPAPPKAVVPDNPFDGWEATPDPSAAAGANREGARAALIGPFGLSDLGNANRLVAWRGHEIRYAVDSGAWLRYANGIWDDQAGEVAIEHAVKEAIELARVNEGDLHDDTPHDVEAKNPKSDRSEFFSWMGKTEAYARVSSAVKMARSDPRIHVSMGAFDANPMLFNAANCAVDLSTGTPIAHSPDLMFRHQSPIYYDPSAKCPLWQTFLHRTQPDPAMRAWLQEVLGYSMTGQMGEHAIFLHNGPGATGKTTFLEVVKEVMGDYGQKLDRETLMSKGSSSGAIPADLARMAGARFLAASETATGKKLDDERVKELVGGDSISARHLYGKWFDFRPTGKIHMATNHLPGFESGGDGMGRRLRLVPWEQQIPLAEQDKTLKDRILATEAAGVLAWLIEGAVKWASGSGLITPASVDARSKEHIRDADPVTPFIEERLVLGEGHETEFAKIYASYEAWAPMNTGKPMSARAFSMALVERLGHESKFLAPGTRRSTFRVGIRMIDVSEWATSPGNHIRAVK